MAANAEPPPDVPVPEEHGMSIKVLRWYMLCDLVAHSACRHGRNKTSTMHCLQQIQRHITPPPPPPLSRPRLHRGARQADSTMCGVAFLVTCSQRSAGVPREGPVTGISRNSDQQKPPQQGLSISSRRTQSSLPHQDLLKLAQQQLPVLHQCHQVLSLLPYTAAIKHSSTMGHAFR